MNTFFDTAAILVISITIIISGSAPLTGEVAAVGLLVLYLCFVWLFRDNK